MADYAGKPSSFYSTTGGVPVEGAWYSGQRYLGGKLLAPGEYEPGKMTSSEVMAQSSVAAGLAPGAYESFISSQYAGGKIPSQESEVTPYLSNFQKTAFSTYNAPELKLPDIKIPTMEELKTQLTPTTPLPETLNRMAEFEKMRTEQKVGDLEQTLNNLKGEIDEEYATLRTQRGLEEGKPVALGVISGRISEEERVAQERIDFLGRQQSRITDQLNTKYNLINTYMNFMSLDYNDAVKRYDDEFNRNLKMYDIISGREEFAVKTAIDVYQIERATYEFDVNAARANLQIFANLATKGNIDYNSLPSDTKLMMTKLEIQAGLPVGLISSIRKDADADIIFTTSNEGVTQVGIRNADGSISVQSYGTRIGGAGGLTTTQSRTYTSSAMKILDEIDRTYMMVGGKTGTMTEREEPKTQGDKLMSQAEANYALEQIINEVGSQELGKQIFLQAWNEGGYKKW